MRDKALTSTGIVSVFGTGASDKIAARCCSMVRTSKAGGVQGSAGFIKADLSHRWQTSGGLAARSLHHPFRARLFPPHLSSPRGKQFLVAGTSTHQIAQGGLRVAKETVAHRAVSGQTRAVTIAAKRPGDRGDNADIALINIFI